MIKIQHFPKELIEGGTARLQRHLSEDNTWAIISTYLDDKSEEQNYTDLQELKQSVKSEHGFIEFIARWVSNNGVSNERSLLIPNIEKSEAIKYGKKYNQNTIIVKDVSGCYELCITPYETYKQGDIVRTFNINPRTIMNIETAKEIFAHKLLGSASNPVKGTRPFSLKVSSDSIFELYEVQSPRPAYFQDNESISRIF